MEWKRVRKDECKREMTYDSRHFLGPENLSVTVFLLELLKKATSPARIYTWDERVRMDEVVMMKAETWLKGTW